MKNILDEIKRIERLDRSNMRDLLLNFAKGMGDAHSIASRFDLPGRYKKQYRCIVVAGVGGSAIGGDFIKSYLEEELSVPLIVNRDYTIPGIVGKGCLFIVSSYSGNTEETLGAYEAALKSGSDIIAVTSGGKLLDSAVRRGIPFIRIPGGAPPRCALAYGTIPYLALFSKLGIISSKDKDIKEARRVLTAMRDELAPSVPQRKNIAKRIARKLLNRFPVIYGGRLHLEPVVTRWRGQLAENSKTIASAHVFPEMNHNEIEGWANPKGILKNFAVIFLRDSGDHPRVKRRMALTKSIIKTHSRPRIIEVESRGRSLLARLFSLVCIGDWVSFYLAILYRTDPTPVDRISYLKKKLAE